MSAVSPVLDRLDADMGKSLDRLFGLLRGDDAKIGAEVRGVVEPASENTGHLATLRWELVP